MLDFLDAQKLWRVWGDFWCGSRNYRRGRPSLGQSV